MRLRPELSIAALLLWCGQYCAAQGEARRFKSGDYVEVLRGGSWRPCMVAGSYRSDSSEYPVSCGAQDFVTRSDAAHLRSRTPTEDDVRIAAETSAGLVRLTRPGNGVGRRYGTREPKTCASRRDPLNGAPSVEQAREYFICDIEAERVTSLALVTNVRLEIASGRSFNAQTDSGRTGVDPKQLIYDIRGSFTHFECRPPARGDNAFSRTHNCSGFEEPAAQGSCYKNTFGDWHCTMLDLHADIVHPRIFLSPPEGN